MHPRGSRWIAAMLAVAALAVAAAVLAAPNRPVPQRRARLAPTTAQKPASAPAAVGTRRALIDQRDDLRLRHRAGPAGAERVQTTDVSRRIDVNNLSMFVTNVGSFANDFENQNNSGLFFPKGTIKTAVYESGLWLGATVNGETRVTVSEYSQEYGPGPMTGPGAWADPQDPRHIVYKVVRFSGDPADTSHLEQPAAAVAADRTLDPIIHHSWSEYLNGAAPFGAPTRLWDLPDPNNPGGTVSVLGPDVSGDQMLWSVYNDADPSNHTNDAGGTTPLGVEVQQSTFGFNRQGALGNTVFMRFLIINKGGNTLENMFVSLWSDPDLGGAGDDLVGSDTTLSLGYVYNATNNDQVYGTAPPAVGYDFFLGPFGLPMTSFNKYINGTDPASPTESYTYMQGLDGPTGDPIIDPTTGDPTAFFHPGDPVTGTGWLDTNPADRRFLLSSGPFTLAPGESVTVVGAIVVAQGSDRLSSITGLKFFDVTAQDAFDRNFDLPAPPPQPKVTASVSHGTVQLCWDSASRFGYNAPPGYAFEGYVVYQGASLAGPWKRLATFDLVDDIKVVRDTVFDTNTGQLITDYPVVYGGDNGVQYCYSTSTDAIRGGPLRDAQEYYFAVTAYSVGFFDPLTNSGKVLENAQQYVRVIPQRPASGTDVGSALVNCPTVVQANPALPPTKDQVVTSIVDPTAITGHTYSVFYSASGAWNLRDDNTGQTLIANQTDRTSTPEYAPVDGMVVTLLGDSVIADDVLGPVYICPARPGGSVIQPVDAGLSAFGGGADVAWNFFAGIDPTAQPELFNSVELRFGETQKGYRYFRDETESGSAPANTGRGYTYGGFHDVPMTAWDTENNLQLDIGWVERRITDDDGNPVGTQPATQDATWGPDNSDLGGREYLAISRRTYTPTEKPELAQDGGFVGADTLWLYAAWLRTEGPIPPGETMRFTWGTRPGTPNDTIRFTTSALQRSIATLQKTGLDRIRVVPNPYYSRSRYEITQFNRVVKFVNMPEQCTVRIFNLAGKLVRTLQKTDATTSILQWDLMTQNRLPVGSGIYIYHVDVPGAGSTSGRMVVFMEKERLNSF